jgi:chaperone required for assembly of F1-ATPase
MKKFYQTAESGTAPGGFVVRLDGKPIKTPLQHMLLIQSHKLAEAIATEWQTQGDEIKPETMPLTRLANTMVDKAKTGDRAEMEDQVLHYGGSDLVCYFATHPATLVKEHEMQWKPLISWMKSEYDISFDIICGIKYQHQPQPSLDRLRKLVQSLSPADFTIVQAATATTGSIIIALALLEGKLTPEAAYQAACADEIHQLKTWGEDAEAQKRLDIIKADLNDVAKFRDLVKATK